jgi:hypothetical protein
MAGSELLEGRFSFLTPNGLLSVGLRVANRATGHQPGNGQRQQRIKKKKKKEATSN